MKFAFGNLGRNLIELVKGSWIIKIQTPAFIRRRRTRYGNGGAPMADFFTFGLFQLFSLCSRVRSSFSRSLSLFSSLFSPLDIRGLEFNQETQFSDTVSAKLRRRSHRVHSVGFVRYYHRCRCQSKEKCIGAIGPIGMHISFEFMTTFLNRRRNRMAIDHARRSRGPRSVSYDACIHLFVVVSRGTRKYLHLFMLLIA